MLLIGVSTIIGLAIPATYVSFSVAAITARLVWVIRYKSQKQLKARTQSQNTGVQPPPQLSTGWYPDPYEFGYARFWSGTFWAGRCLQRDLTSLTGTMRSCGPPAWHVDPAGHFDHRFWDGNAWTHHVARQGQHLIDDVGPFSRPDAT